MKLFNTLSTLIMTLLSVYVSVSAYVDKHIEDAKLFAIWGCLLLLLGIFNKEENGKENKD